MRHRNIRRALAMASVSFAALTAASAAFAAGATVTYAPYIQPGDAGLLGDRDQIVVTWQTNEKAPNPSAYKVQFGLGESLFESAQVSGRVVDNYLAADPSLPVPPTAYGAHTNYTAVLRNLKLDAVYSYKVTGPGLPAGGFASWFPTRKTGDHFSYLVTGDEGFFPTYTNNTALVADYEARIVHLMYNSGKISLPGQPMRPQGDFALNTGDNIYNSSAEDSYRDFWFPVWNSDVDSVDRGAPFIRTFKNYIVTGNHDIGGNGDFVNLLATAGAAPYAGQTGGGDALAYFNNYYFPLNGPSGVDAFNVFNGDTATPNGAFFSYNSQTYTSPAAGEALRASTLVDSGTGPKRQIDHMGNYSFDYGNAHFVFLDSNPHVFDSQVDGAALYAGPPDVFSAYPSILREWLINDLDASDKLWKIVVYHHPAFSSGYATMRNNQMRAVATLLQDHGVNIVYNGHEHNYQRTRPIRATPAVTNAVSETAPAVVAMDTAFDGVAHRVPDGVLHVVEGAGGNRDFDGDEANPRGSGLGLDQDDSATGTFVAANGESYPQGPASWLDTHITAAEMDPAVPGAGQGSKITVLFKAKVFSFGHAVVEGNKLTHYQISEPLLNSSSATTITPAPFGLDYYGRPINDPIPDTMVDPATGQVVGVPPQGTPFDKWTLRTPALLDKWAIEKPDLDGQVTVQVAAQPFGKSGDVVVVTNKSSYALNGAQLVLENADGYAGPLDDTHTVAGGHLVITLGRIAPGATTSVAVPIRGGDLNGVLRSATAQPVSLGHGGNGQH
jgi:hypothetical protein